MSGALENLKSCQGQVDADGVWVAVSRQALEETFVFIDGLQERIAELQKVAEAADCILHWHDTHNGGMIVSAEHVRALWQSLAECKTAGYLKE